MIVNYVNTLSNISKCTECTVALDVFVGVKRVSIKGPCYYYEDKCRGRAADER